MHSFNGTRQRRNLLDINGFAPIQFPLTSYSTNTRTETKEEMKHTYGDTLIFNNLHLIPDPLKKNLADSVITGEENKKTSMYGTKTTERPHRPDYYPTLAGITSFFSGVMNVMGAMFQKRATSPPSPYYDCFENYNEQQMAPPAWQTSNIEVQNKNEQELFIFASNNEVNTNLETEMNTDCRLSAKHCEDKLNQVRLLLSKNQINEQPSKYRLNRPRKAFVEAGSVEESFEDAFSPEDFATLAKDPVIEYYSPYNYHNEEISQADAPKLKTEMYIKENTDITNSLPVEEKEIENENQKTVINDSTIVNTEEVVNSCEDKLNKLKALLQRSKKVVNTEPEVTEKQPEITQPIPLPNKPLNQEVSDTVFGTEISSTEIQSSQDSNYFNEVTGKFYGSSLDSNDSFQIVFSDSPSNCRRRIPSECDSEDSFIVFEESPESCYTSHDIFGEEIDIDHSDSDSDDEEDPGVTCKIAHNLSRTVGDLTDDSLYSEDVVDSVQICEKISNDNLVEPEVTEGRKGVLLDKKRKAEKEKLPPKTVTFSSQPPKVHVMRVWAFAAKQARVGEWERHALDRERFQRRIADVEMAVSWVLERKHRTRIVFQRFRPWWNAQKRKERAERKAKGEQKHKKEAEMERKREEEIEHSEEHEMEHNGEEEMKHNEEEEMEHNGEGNMVKETEDDPTEDSINADIVIDSYVSCKENGDLNGFVDEKDLVESEQTMQCTENISNSSLIIESAHTDTDKHDTEITIPVENISRNTSIPQYEPKNGIKDIATINVTKLNKFQDKLLITDGSVDT